VQVKGLQRKIPELFLTAFLLLLSQNTPLLCFPGLESDFLAVLTDYPSPDISPPIFRRGEKLRVISE
jgi:hypothetical protein